LGELLFDVHGSKRRQALASEAQPQEVFGTAFGDLDGLEGRVWRSVIRSTYQLKLIRGALKRPSFDKERREEALTRK
jgi:hypothetical protein